MALYKKDRKCGYATRYTVFSIFGCISSENIKFYGTVLKCYEFLN